MQTDLSELAQLTAAAAAAAAAAASVSGGGGGGDGGGSSAGAAAQGSLEAGGGSLPAAASIGALGEAVGSVGGRVMRQLDLERLYERLPLLKLAAPLLLPIRLPATALRWLGTRSAPARRGSST